MRNLLIVAAIAFSASVRAEFNETNRSINGTGETLAKGTGEVGFRTLAVGITDRLMISTPTLSVLTGQSEVELRYKHQVTERARVSPAVIAGTPVHFGARVDFGFDLGERREHSFTASLQTDWAARTDIPLDSFAVGKTYRFTHAVGAEYDLYWAGNLAYVGFTGRVPYLGFTWAWEHFHFGLITSPLSRFLPFPYVYWRF